MVIAFVVLLGSKTRSAARVEGDCDLYSNFFVGATSSLISLNTTPSPKAMSVVSEKVQTPSLSSIESLSTKKTRISVSSIISSTSEVRSVSSVADPTVIANLSPNKGESEILYSSERWKSEVRILRLYFYLQVVLKNCFLIVVVFL